LLATGMTIEYHCDVWPQTKLKHQKEKPKLSANPWAQRYQLDPVTYLTPLHMTLAIEQIGLKAGKRSA
jgi:hypothetical protein